MIARLGMRAGEVRQLHLNDIDWIEGEIHVRAGKSRRERPLPLLEEVGKALSVYLREERPESAERSIFLTLLPPYRPLVYSTAISRISRHIFEEQECKARDWAHIGYATPSLLTWCDADRHSRK